MNTLHRFAEAAVQRDLHRARAVLVDDVRLSPERRTLLTEHLVWMAGLVGPGEHGVYRPARAVVAAARDLAASGGREQRVELVGAIDALLRATSSAAGWTSPEALRGLGEQVPWLLDGVAMPVGSGLLVRQSGDRELGRLRAASYRRGKFRLWGTVSLEVPAQPDGGRPNRPAGLTARRSVTAS